MLENTTPPEPNKENTCCVFVTFHPDDAFPERLARVAPQVARIVIVDNKSDPAAISMLQREATRWDATLILNDSNVGQASALNQGMRWAIDQGYDWMLTMDQDSIAYGNLVEGLAGVHQSWPRTDKVAIIGANYLDGNNSMPLFSIDDEVVRVMHKRPEGPGPHLAVEAVTVITTGCLTSLAAAKVIGPFRDEFFIDRVDDEYCLRARAKGFKVLLTTKILMEHVIGTPTRGDLLWKKNLIALNASPTRRYYQSRNHAVLAREYFATEREWVKWSLRVRWKEMMLMLFLERDRTRKILKVLQGLFDAIVGRMGKMRWHD